jgi:uncharacterized protein YkwD
VRRCLLVSLVCLGACKTGAPRPSPGGPAAPAAPAADGDGPRAARALSPAIDPQAPGAARYGAAGAAWIQRRPDPLRAAIVDEVKRLARAAGRAPPAPDVRLDAAMNDLAGATRSAGDLPAFEVVDFLLGHYGLFELTPHLVLVRAGPAADDEVRARIADQLSEALKAGNAAHVGVGVQRTADALAVVVALQEKHVELAPVRRLLPVGGRAPIVGRLLPGHAKPQVIVTGPGGQVWPLASKPQGASFRAELRCDRSGRYQVEVTGEGARGVAVLANFPVFCGAAPPTAAPPTVAGRRADVDVAEAEARMLELLNRDRGAAGLPLLAPDRRLADVARAHSRDMADNDFVGHVSPSTGTVMDRVRRAGLDPPLLLENIGRAYSPDEAHAGLMLSPGHRANILSPQATRVGIGIVLSKPVTGSRPLLVTQLFI